MVTQINLLQCTGKHSIAWRLKQGWSWKDKMCFQKHCSHDSDNQAALNVQMQQWLSYYSSYMAGWSDLFQLTLLLENRCEKSNISCWHSLMNMMAIVNLQMDTPSHSARTWRIPRPALADSSRARERDREERARAQRYETDRSTCDTDWIFD
jgi:hypothetical protein